MKDTTVTGQVVKIIFRFNETIPRGNVLWRQIIVKQFNRRWQNRDVGSDTLVCSISETISLDGALRDLALESVGE